MKYEIEQITYLKNIWFKNTLISFKIDYVSNVEFWNGTNNEIKEYVILKPWISFQGFKFNKFGMWNRTNNKIIVYIIEKNIN